MAWKKGKNPIVLYFVAHYILYLHPFQVIDLYIKGLSFVLLAWQLYCVETLHLPGHPSDAVVLRERE